MPTLFERKLHTPKPDDAPFDAFFQTFGVRMELEDLIEIRDHERYMLDLGQIDESDIYPTPPYLVEQWEVFVLEHPHWDAED